MVILYSLMPTFFSTAVLLLALHVYFLSLSFTSSLSVPSQLIYIFLPQSPSLSLSILSSHIPLSLLWFLSSKIPQFHPISKLLLTPPPAPTSSLVRLILQYYTLLLHCSSLTLHTGLQRCYVTCQYTPLGCLKTHHVLSYPYRILHWLFAMVKEIPSRWSHKHKKLVLSIF